MRLHLTDQAIRKLPAPPTGTKKYWDTVQPGFGIRIGPRSRSYFVVFGPRRQLKTLAPYGSMSLSEARREARRYLDHIAPKNLATSLTAAVSAYLAECEETKAPNTVRSYRRYLSRVSEKPLSELSKADITTTDPHECNAWKIFANWCCRNELLERNPFQYLNTKNHDRSRVLNDHEIQLIWAYTHPPYSDYLKLLLLTGQRRGQFTTYTIDGDTVHFPADVMKNQRPHSIPVTDYTKALLEHLAPFNGWSKAKARLDAHVPLPHWTLHDLRRTHSTLQAQLGTPIHVTERILSHTSGTISGVAATYNRYHYEPEMRKALELLENYVHSIVAQGTHP